MVAISFFRILFLTLAMLMVSGLSAVAQVGRQDASPVPVPADQEAPDAGQGLLDLAAMALDSTDIPPEFVLFYETYLDTEALLLRIANGIVSREELEGTGFIRYYESSYSTPEGGARIRSYVEEFVDDLGAANGFVILEDESRLVPTAQFSDEPGPGIGQEPSEISIGTFLSTEPGAEPTTIDITFRYDRLIAGVTMDVAAGSTIDRELTIQLAQALHDRIEAVLGNADLPLIDTSIPRRYVELGPSWMLTNEGYWSVPEIYGPDIDPGIAAAFESGYFRALAFDPEGLGGFALPRVAIGVGQYASEQAVLDLLSGLATGQPINALLEPLEIDSIPGTSVTLGYGYANTFMSGATTDSVRIVMLIGSALVTVDVQGNGTLEAAKIAALAIATAQAECLQSQSECDVEALPDELFSAPSTPVATDPVG